MDICPSPIRIRMPHLLKKDKRSAYEEIQVDVTFVMTQVKQKKKNDMKFV